MYTPTKNYYRKKGYKIMYKGSKIVIKSKIHVYLVSSEFNFQNFSGCLLLLKPAPPVIKFRVKVRVG